MATNQQKLLFCFLLLNVTLGILNFTGTGQSLWDHSKKTSLQTLTVLNATNGSQNLLRGSHKATSSLEDPTHPFDLLPKRLEELEWDPERIDEVVRKHWKTDKTFLRPQTDEKTKEIRTILSTSCLHNAAWIVTSLLELQTRPNYYRGIYQLPEDPALIVYDNTKKPRSPDAAPVIESLRNFIASRPSDEPIVLQVDMYEVKDKPHLYLDHHFALHIYKGQVNLYHGWQHLFNLIDWMKQPGMHKMRYPMPVETFFDLFAKALNHTEDLMDRERLEANWKVFGITDTFIDGPRTTDLDPVVRALRFPQIVPLITHWPNPQTHSSAVKSL